MTPAQLFALTHGESEVNKRAEASGKQGPREVKHVTSPEQSNLLKMFNG